MSAPESAEIGAKEYEVSIVYGASETITVGGEEAQTLVEAIERASNQSYASLCHQCAAHLSLGDPVGEVVTIRHQDGTETTYDSIDDERDADAARHQEIGQGAAYAKILDLISRDLNYTRGDIVDMIQNERHLLELAQQRRRS